MMPNLDAANIAYNLLRVAVVLPAFCDNNQTLSDKLEESLSQSNDRTTWTQWRKTREGAGRPPGGNGGRTEGAVDILPRDRHSSSFGTATVPTGWTACTFTFSTRTSWLSRHSKTLS